MVGGVVDATDHGLGVAWMKLGGRGVVMPASAPVVSVVVVRGRSAARLRLCRLRPSGTSLALQVVRDHPPHVGGIPGGLLHGLLDAAGGNGPGYIGNVFLALGDRPAAVPLLLLFGEDGVGDHELGLLAFLDVCRGAHVLQASGGQLGVCDVLVIVVVIVIEEGRRQDITVVEVVLRHGLDGPDDLLLAGRVVVGSSVRRREFCGGQLSHGRDEVDSGAIVEGEASSTAALTLAGIAMSLLSLCLGVNDVVSIAVQAVAAAGKFTERWPC